MKQIFKFAAAALGGVVVTVVAGGIAFASMDHGLGRLGPVDLNRDGVVTQAEWNQAATAHFQLLDTNKDGKLVVGELPPPHHGRHGGHGFGPGRDDAGPAAPPAAPAPAPVGNVAAPAN